ncbi:hypothetical protein M5D96_013638 [Drosophila gunungcola]|uniref:Uncharacterized protein n=1 Tax=Drosophila gunungcola TaxID=103775 RepID=A0A9P9YBP9_9MUSC|nr:hypothetical protein M5D96_013638 [Drosophila gunungcola]
MDMDTIELSSDDSDGSITCTLARRATGITGIYLFRTNWEMVQVEAPYRPPDDPIVSFPTSPVHLCIMGPDETNETEGTDTRGDRPTVDLTSPQDEEMGSELPTTSSPTTFDLLLGQIAPEMENLRWESTTDWDLHGPNHPQPEERASNDGHSDSDDVPTPGRERYPFPDGWTCNSTDGRVPAVGWQTICARQLSARMSRQRFRVATDEGSYQVTMKPTGAGAVSFLPRK